MPVDVEIIDVESHLFGAAHAEATLAGMEYRLEHMRPALTGIVREVERHTLEQFESRGSVSGDPWAPLEQGTIREKRREGSLTPDWPLVRTGALLESATSPAGPFSRQEVLESEAALGVDWDRDGWQIPVLHQEGVPWREVHRKSYTRADGTHVAATSYMWHLPARPIFTVTDELADRGADRIVRYVMFNPLG